MPERQLKDSKSQFIKIFNNAKNVSASVYLTVGFKPNTRFMVHLSAPEAQNIQQFTQKLIKSSLGRYLKITYTLLGLVRPSQYNSKHQEIEKAFKDGAYKYLIVYPFTKSIEWHLLPFEERREMMKEHVMTARKFVSSINQLLLYAYGVDDHEFIVSYQTDSLPDFQSLVMELRGTKGRAYTKNDLPIFLGTYTSISEALETL